MLSKLVSSDVRGAIKVLYKELYREHMVTAHFENIFIDTGDISCLQLLQMLAMTFGIDDEEFNRIADEAEKEGR
jgi:predicted DsbA family dithiol-disulfide isomerase